MDFPGRRTPPHAHMLAALRARADASGLLGFHDFIATALYAPEGGYYRAARPRVGRHPQTDFYTASSLGPVFGRLLRAAATQLLKEAGRAPADFHLVEIAAEPQQGVFGEEAGDFAALHTLRLGDALHPPPRAVIFANEWLDALPFHRLLFEKGQWHERGVRILPDGSLEEALLPRFSAPVAAQAHRLPPQVPEGWQLDWPLDAETALHALVSRDWQGLLLLADYGKTWQELLEACPQGTARAYSQHRQHNDLLDAPGQQDLTCDLCWDALENVLRSQGFQQTAIERQEAFFLHHATEAVRGIIAGKTGFSEETLHLRALLHPAHFGHRFQVLRAWR